MGCGEGDKSNTGAREKRGICSTVFLLLPSRCRGGKRSDNGRRTHERLSINELNIYIYIYTLRLPWLPPISLEQQVPHPPAADKRCSIASTRHALALDNAPLQLQACENKAGLESDRYKQPDGRCSPVFFLAMVLCDAQEEKHEREREERAQCRLALHRRTTAGLLDGPYHQPPEGEHQPKRQS